MDKESAQLSPESEESLELAALCDVIGFPRKLFLNPAVVEYVSHSLIDVFSDHGLPRGHKEELDDPVLVDWFGASSLTDGRFAQRVEALMNTDDPELRSALLRLQEDAARNVAPLVWWNDPSYTDVNEQMPSIGIGCKQSRWVVGFDGIGVPLAGYPQRVIDFGPGIVGRHHIIRQSKMAEMGIRPYEYVPISHRPFINNFLQVQTELALGDPSLLPGWLEMGMLEGWDAGIAASTTQMIELALAANESPETADLVLCSQVHMAGLAELTTGIRNAYQLLKPQGTLVVRNPQSAHRPGWARADELMEAAVAAGFTEGPMAVIEADAIIPDLDNERAALLTIVYKK